MGLFLFVESFVSAAKSSPFRGMDPFAEARHLWKGLHTQLIGELSVHSLPPLLAPAYYVDAEPSLQVRQQSFVPDVQVMAAPEGQELLPAGLGMPVAEATLTVTVAEESDEEEESAIFVREAGSERLVTVIEILSYSNKSAGAEKRARYLFKRRELLAAGIHLVEVDLLRWGQRITSSLPARPYHILISRADEFPRSRVWSFGLDEPIPDTPLPLLGAREHVPLPVQSAFKSIYKARNFRQRLPYTSDPEPPLTEQQRGFVTARLQQEGLRL